MFKANPEKMFKFILMERITYFGQRLKAFGFVRVNDKTDSYCAQLTHSNLAYGLLVSNGQKSLGIKVVRLRP